MKKILPVILFSIILVLGLFSYLKQNKSIREETEFYDMISRELDSKTLYWLHFAKEHNYKFPDCGEKEVWCLRIINQPYLLTKVPILENWNKEEEESIEEQITGKPLVYTFTIDNTWCETTDSSGRKSYSKSWRNTVSGNEPCEGI